MNRPADLLRLMRPHQWVKNLFILAGVVFGRAWGDPETVARVAAAATGFCLAASAVYLLNDVTDRNEDRRHPTKRHRPLAAGRVSVPAALALAAFLLVGGIALEILAGRVAVFLVSVYVLQNVAYSLGLKRVVILDVFLISMGFMLRLLVGTVGIGIPPSNWLLVSGFTLTLLFGFAKRRAELDVVANAASRPVLERYSPVVLDTMISITAACAIMSYSLYTLSPQTIAVHDTTELIYTIPLVVYAILRYLYVLYVRGGSGDISRDLLTDPHIAVSAGGWAILTLLLLS